VSWRYFALADISSRIFVTVSSDKEESLIAGLTCSASNDPGWHWLLQIGVKGDVSVCAYFNSIYLKETPTWMVTPERCRKKISQRKTYVAKAYAAQGSTSKMAPLTIRRRAPRPQDVQIDILYCGVCHSDLHQVRNQWQNAMPTTYPCVPGHEIVGRVVKTPAAQ
jgi:hypothetical protein